MPGEALALVAMAAAIHAAWNALAKRAGDQLAFLWSSVSVAALAFLGPGLALLPPGGVPAAAWPFVAATIAIHAGYFAALGRAYAGGEYSLVYPVARGLGVALVPVLGWALLGEGLSPLGALGVALVVAGIAAVGRAGASRARAGPGGRGLGWAAATGLTIAGYSLVDKAGVTRLHPLPYLAFMGLGISLCLTPWVLRGGRLAAEWRRNWRAILVASVLNLTSYLLVLFAFRLSKAAYVVAARELSIVLSVVIGRLWLGEAGLRARLPGAALILAGAVCVALAR
jgi:drug/metabolite transporter (DMT)-like permease